MTVIKRYILSSLLVLILCVVGVGFNSQPVQASSQVIFAGYPDALNNANATEYNSIMGGNTWVGGTSTRFQLLPTAGKIKSLYIELDNTVGAADDTYTFTLMYDGAASALTCEIGRAHV
jgi:hypothetical protein